MRKNSYIHGLTENQTLAYVLIYFWGKKWRTNWRKIWWRYSTSKNLDWYFEANILYSYKSV